MGVPAFFRWLSNKYAHIIVNAVEERQREVNGVQLPINTAAPNPIGVEFDNLYLDMNGIIHPCTHPEDRPPPRNEDEMMTIIFDYIDRIFSIIRPRKLLYMAIDGVAPRAKMNQQRSRRFRAAKEARESAEEIDKVRKELELNGIELPKKTSHFDSNVITPGTEFMEHLAECLKYYVHDRLNNDQGWRGVKVILSDASVPGEGEHKIMEYIRRQRACPTHNPNTRHVLYGADADLIMLGLATHEPYFTILREEFQPNQPRPCSICNQMGHDMYNCQGVAREKRGEHDELAPLKPRKEFIMIRLHVLREYLERELRIGGLSFPFDIERAIDDWVFMCFFVGNDFLPHLPSLEIREGAIDRLVGIYKRLVPRMGGYITDSGSVDVVRAQMVLTELGTMEDGIFRERQEKELRRRTNEKRRRMEHQRRRDAEREMYDPNAGRLTGRELRETATALRVAAMKREQELDRDANRKAAVELRNQFRKEMMSAPGEVAVEAAPSDEVRMEPVQPSDDNGAADGQGEEAAGADGGAMEGVAETLASEDAKPAAETAPAHGEKRKREDDEEPSRTNDDDEEESEPDDDVRLWEEGWKDRYYQSKFKVSATNTQFVKSVARSYLEGLCWVLAYYYQGCPSWKWFYPYHYAPFASDMQDLGIARVTFERRTVPFKPIEQLMGVFPAASGRFLPPKCIELMTREDSPIIDFYPTDFAIDLNGKKAAWQGVALLPFIDEARLLAAMQEVYSTLTPDEMRRNKLGDNILHVGVKNPLFDSLCKVYESADATEVPIDGSLSGGMGGTVTKVEGVCLPGSTYPSPLPHEGLRDLENNQVISVVFRDPVYPDDFVFPARLLPGVAMPSKELSENDHRGGFGGGGSFNHRNGRDGRDGRVPSGPYQQRNPSYDTPAGRMIRHATNIHDQRPDQRDRVSGGFRDSAGYYEDGYRANFNPEQRQRPQQPYYAPPPIPGQYDSGGYGSQRNPPYGGGGYGGYPPQHGYPPQQGYPPNAQYSHSGGGGGYPPRPPPPAGGYGYPPGRPQGGYAPYGNPYGQPPPQRPPQNLAWSRNVESSLSHHSGQGQGQGQHGRYDSRNPSHHPYGGSYAPGARGRSPPRDPRRDPRHR
eukprot:Opistho-1_new@47392